ncbi:MAG: phosphatidylglycerophosphatase A [Bacilli bacterium]|nr:phosphatidylglycerophosphatase A [Bacilli bacterium]MDD4282219.1 phosphatidylglycerophosphatase A [Bacilli bacterium]MDD4718218.1 phosphatidylglycerophosphatase A [Bacilli bacterium]
MNILKELAVQKLKDRGVKILDIADIVFNLQKKYIEDLTIEDCISTIDSIIAKREVTHAILTGIAIDETVEKDLFEEPINKIIKTDDSLYGIDEILPLSIVNIYGSIAFTNFGYLDKTKPGIIGKLDTLGKDGKQCHTFLDDIICAIASSAASRLAHKNRID